MGHTVHPRAFRLAAGRAHFDHAWYSDHSYTLCVLQDVGLAQYVQRLAQSLQLPHPRWSVSHGAQASHLALLFCVPRAGRLHRTRRFRLPSGMPMGRSPRGRQELPKPCALRQGWSPSARRRLMLALARGTPLERLLPATGGLFTSLPQHLGGWARTPVLCQAWRTGQEWQEAGFLADEIVYLLERRVPFRQIKHRILRRLRWHPMLLGLRVSCAGRVGGRSKKAQRARRDRFQAGPTSFQTLEAPMGYAARRALTPLGVTGVKVWLRYRQRASGL
jgi:hypothetical protein